MSVRHFVPAMEKLTNTSSHLWVEILILTWEILHVSAAVLILSQTILPPPSTPALLASLVLLEHASSVPVSRPVCVWLVWSHCHITGTVLYFICLTVEDSYFSPSPEISSQQMWLSIHFLYMHL